MDSENHLLAYVRSGDEVAFAKVVEAYSALVYGTAYRKTRNAQLAEEITQNVFVLLARKAEKLVSRPGLGVWLHRTALLVSQNLLRSEASYQRRMALVREQGGLSSERDVEIFFEGVDEALDRLSESDRMVVMMRFFEEKEFREIGAKVGKSADAVQKQIRRALEKLNRSLTAKGSTFSLGAVGLLLSSELAKAAPVASSAVISAKAVGSSSSVPLLGQLFANFFHSMNTLKTSTAVAAILLVAVIPTVILYSDGKEVRQELTDLRARKSLTMTRSTPSLEIPARTLTTPVKRILASSKSSLSGEEFLLEMQRAMMSDNLSQVFQMLLNIALMNDTEVQNLLAEVEAVEGYSHVKGTAISALMGMLPESGEDRGSRLTRGIANAESVEELGMEMSDWVRDDLGSALAWFRASQADGSLFGKGVSSVEPRLGAIIAAKFAETDVQAALEVANSVELSGRATVLAGIAGVLAGEEQEGLSPLIDSIKELQDVNAVNKVVDAAVRTMVKSERRDEVLPFLEIIDAEPSTLSRALSTAMRSAPESVSEKMDWLQDNVTESFHQEAVTLAVKTLYGNSTEELREWIDSQPRGAIRDSALVSESSAMMYGAQGREAMERVDLIGDEVVREKQREELMKRWKLLNPDMDISETLGE